LANPAQIRLVTAPVGRNLLIWPAPVREKPKGCPSLAPTYFGSNAFGHKGVLVVLLYRYAAIELRRRLRDLVGDDARGLPFVTYHGLAMRLLGFFLRRRSRKAGVGIDFDALIAEAVKILRGEITRRARG